MAKKKKTPKNFQAFQDQLLQEHKKLAKKATSQYLEIINKYKNKELSLQSLLEHGVTTVLVGTMVEYSFYKRLVDDRIVDVSTLIQFFKSIECLEGLLKHPEFFDIETLTLETFHTLFQCMNTNREYWNLTQFNSQIVEFGLEHHTLSFERFVNALKELQCMFKIFNCHDLFENILNCSPQLVSNEDIKHLLSMIEDKYELNNFCCNAPLVSHVLENELIDGQLLDKLNEVVSKNIVELNASAPERINSIFDHIEVCLKHNEHKEENSKRQRIFELARDMNKTLHCRHMLSKFKFNEEVSAEEIKAVKNNETAKNRLEEILDNHIENSFETKTALFSYLFKSQKYQLLNI